MRLILILWGFFLALQASSGGIPDMETDPGSAHPLKRFDAEALDRSMGEKFLLFEVVEVKNPEAVPLAFTVYYLPTGKDRRYLGSFSLYPPDNPGRFLVPTQGKVGKDGEILLYLLPPEDAKSAKSVHVNFNDIKMVDRLDHE